MSSDSSISSLRWVRKPAAVKSCSGSSMTEEIIRQWASVVTDAGGLRWVKEMLALNVAVDDADGWQAERYQRGETGQRPGYTGNPFRPR